MARYELIGEQQRCSYWRTAAFVVLYVATTALVFFAWSSAYDETPLYPPFSNVVPAWWSRRIKLYAQALSESTEVSHDFRLVRNQSTASVNKELFTDIPQQQTGNDVPSVASRLVCYYVSPVANDSAELLLANVPPTLCTHINIGPALMENSVIKLTASLERVLRLDVPSLRAGNSELKLLLWIGGGGTGHEFALMIKNHLTRKSFIQSLKAILRDYKLDGVDLDFEFPSAYNKERQHFSQLLYELRQEFRREKRDYLLSIAVAAPEGIAFFAYDVREINLYADYVNLMTYDFHFYSSATPFTGLNAPLFARSNEHSIMGTLNINYSVNWWLTNGLNRTKLVVGLPTYGHSFTLVNPLNNKIGAPAKSFGRCGSQGFTTYSEVCWFNSHNLIVSSFYDQQTCSPFLSSASEWISFENEKSIECKTSIVKANNLGGVMIFSLNSDDYRKACRSQSDITFPLIATAKKILFSE